MYRPGGMSFFFPPPLSQLRGTPHLSAPESYCCQGNPENYQYTIPRLKSFIHIIRSVDVQENYVCIILY